MNDRIMGEIPGVNSIFLHYRIISKIGAGGMGEVYLAQDTRLDRRVAIKFLNEELNKTRIKLNRFIQVRHTLLQSQTGTSIERSP